MSKSLIWVTNQSDQTVADNSIINPGSTQRRYGCDLKQSGNGIEISGSGYFKVIGNVTVAPTETGLASVGIFLNGVQINGAISSSTVTVAGDSVTLPLTAVIRRGCRCEGADNMTVVLIDGAGTVSNLSLIVEKS